MYIDIYSVIPDLMRPAGDLCTLPYKFNNAEYFSLVSLWFICILIKAEHFIGWKELKKSVVPHLPTFPPKKKEKIRCDQFSVCQKWSTVNTSLQQLGSSQERYLLFWKAVFKGNCTRNVDSCNCIDKIKCRLNFLKNSCTCTGINLQ